MSKTPSPITACTANNVFSYMSSLANDEPETSPRQKDLIRAAEIGRRLGVLRSDFNTCPPNLKNLDISEFSWTVQTKFSSELHTFPRSPGHSGNFAWDVTPTKGTPRWLWDSTEGRTISASEEALTEGYVAVSYSWGRWRCGLTHVTGTDWQVPIIKTDDNYELLTRLKSILKAIPGCRYFWVDVLCIDQGNRKEKKEEIEKQAFIFGGARGCLVYLWSLNAFDELTHVMASLGDLLLWSVQMPDHDVESQCNLVGHPRLPPHIQHLVDVKLRMDPWFSSLWALQEMVMVPTGIWITDSGSTCLLNNSIVTTKTLAMIIDLLKWSHSVHELFWHASMASYKVQKALPLALALMQDDQNTKRQWEENANAVMRENTEQRVKDVQVGGCFIDVEDQLCFDIPASQASLQRRQVSEYRKARAVRRWVDWAHKKTCLHLCLSASRTQILVAGTNRFSTDRRADAILSALKIKRDESLCATNCLGPGKIPVQLLNKVLELDGSPFFFASNDILNFEESSKLLRHAKGASTGNENPRPLDVLEKPEQQGGDNADAQDDEATPADLESSKWEDGDVVWENLVCFAFCSMLPSIATQFGFSRSRALEEYMALELKEWHIHMNGTVHIPPSAIVQCTSFFDLSPITILPNGLSMPVRMPISKVCQWIAREKHSKALLGSHPEVLLVPLLFRRDLNDVGKKMTFLIEHPGDQVHSELPDVDGTPNVIGIVLIGSCKPNSSRPRTHWSKYGLYHATSCRVKRLGWEHGILVGDTDWDVCCNACGVPDGLGCRGPPHSH